MIFFKKSTAKKVTDTLMGTGTPSKDYPNDRQVLVVIGGMPKWIPMKQSDPQWYHKDFFPLVPIIIKRDANDHNTKSISFNWLCFKLWTMDSFDISFSFVLDTHWGVGFIGNIPYLRWVACIPCPRKVEAWVHSHLWRRPKDQHSAPF